VIVSNCVINLSTDKPAVLRHAYSLLKEGGELYFADVYADRRIPKRLASDPTLYGECLSGAQYWNDFQTLSVATGFRDPRLVDASPIAIHDPKIAKLFGDIRFCSATYRLFKIAQLEAACEDYGQSVIYRGTVEDEPRRFVLDKHCVIERGPPVPVCGNTWRMLHNTRFRTHFDFTGDWDRHYGVFERSAASLPFDVSGSTDPGAGGCC